MTDKPRDEHGHFIAGDKPPEARAPGQAPPDSATKRLHKPKATRKQYEIRVEAARQLLLAGNERARVVSDIADISGVKPRQADNIVIEAEQQIRNVTAVERAYRYAEHVAIRRDIRKRAKDHGDHRIELESAKDEAKLLGLYPAETTNIRVEDIDAAIEREMAELAGRSEAGALDPAAPEEPSSDTNTSAG